MSSSRAHNDRGMHAGGNVKSPDKPDNESNYTVSKGVIIVWQLLRLTSEQALLSRDGCVCGMTKGSAQGTSQSAGISCDTISLRFFLLLDDLTRPFLSLAIQNTGRSVPSRELFHCMIYSGVTFFGNCFFNKRFPISRCATKNMFAIFSFMF